MAAHRKAGVDSAGEAMIDLKPALENRAYAEVLDFLNRIATTGQPNEIAAVWMAHIPHNTSFEHLLDQRNLILLVFAVTFVDAGRCGKSVTSCHRRVLLQIFPKSGRSVVLWSPWLSISVI